MRPLEVASLVCLAMALLALALRAGALGTRRALFGLTAGLMGLQALVEGSRWQLVPAYVVTAIGVALVVRPARGAGAGSRGRRAACVVSAVMALVVAGLLPALLPVPSFPSPEGPHPVGTVTFLLEDPARHDDGEPGRGRRLMAQAWYPADAGAARAARAR